MQSIHFSNAEYIMRYSKKGRESLKTSRITQCGIWTKSAEDIAESTADSQNLLQNLPQSLSQNQ